MTWPSANATCLEERRAETHDRSSPSFWSSAPGAVDDRARVDGGVQADDLDDFPVSSSTRTSAARRPGASATSAMPWPVSGSSPPSFDDLAEPSRAAVLAQVRDGLLERATHHVGRAARRRPGVVRDEVGVRDRESARARASTLEQLRRHEREGAARALAHLGRRAAQRVVPSSSASIAIAARLGVCIPLRSTHRPLPSPALVPADRVGGSPRGTRRSGRRARPRRWRSTSPSRSTLLQAELERVDARAARRACPSARSDAHTACVCAVAAEGAVRREVRVDAARVDRDVRDPVRADGAA